MRTEVAPTSEGAPSENIEFIPTPGVAPQGGAEVIPTEERASKGGGEVVLSGEGAPEAEAEVVPMGKDTSMDGARSKYVHAAPCPKKAAVSGAVTLKGATGK